MTLENKVALVTGAGSGIGEASARLLAARGARVALLGRGEDELETVSKDIRDSGGDTLILKADISVVDQMQEAYKKLDETWGQLDIVFANAGINGVWAPLDELEPEEWQKTLDVNLTGTFYTVKYALPLLKKRGGSIVITASVNGTRIFSNTGATAYSCSKAAQVAFAKMTALELARDRIRVNVICPGSIDTSIDENTEQRNVDKVKIPAEFPEGRIPLTGGEPGTSGQVAELVVFLASDAASHISGTPVWIDGTQSLLLG